jgi:H+/Cl- antiporter ClcA/CBS domain-containing protein
VNDDPTAHQPAGPADATAAVPVSPGLETVERAGDLLDDVRGPVDYRPIDARSFTIVAIAAVVATAAALAAQVLTALIALVTNLAFYNRWSTAFVSPGGGNHSPWAILLVPVVGALIVGLMARYGSAAIRGHGIPEVMERVLHGESRIPARVLFLKPLSAAAAIGTGGPFGAEGPIIATGGALGSLSGQFLHVTADERKTLLAAGAAAGMAATFGTPVSAVLLTVELLLFEYRARSLLPVALAAAIATAIRMAFHGSAPVFPAPALVQPIGSALVGYAGIGIIIGVIAAGITRSTYAIEDLFEKVGHRLHIHWMWWPAMGAVAVGVVGLIEPRTLGVGYENVIEAMSGTITGRALIMLAILKFVSWSIYLGSGTSGGTLAPLFTIGSGIGAWIGAYVAKVAPSVGVTASIGGLVGMAAMFAGASHALLASVVFAFETTRQPVGLLPILIGSTASYLVALTLGRHSIMTEKLARRGLPIRPEYVSDHLANTFVRDFATEEVVVLRASERVADVRRRAQAGAFGMTHQGFPLVDQEGLLVGVLTRRDFMDPEVDQDLILDDLVQRPPIVVYEDSTLRDAADQMVTGGVGRVPVVRRSDPRKIVGIMSRSDLLEAHAPRLKAARHVTRLRRILPGV